LKDAAGDAAETARLVDAAPEGFEVYSGDDKLTLPLLAVGAVGVVGVAANWAPAAHAELLAAWDKGDVPGARALNARLLPSFAFESSEAAPNPLPAKAALRALGHSVGQCRPPLGPAPDGLDDQAREVLAALA
jgi:4-hydroxy-tetrahydrodipicolinate synthase